MNNTMPNTTKKLKQNILSQFAARNSMVIVLIFFVVVCTIISEGRFLRPSNVTTILYQLSIVGVIALGQLIIIISGGIDLSVASVAILSAVIMGGTSSLRQQVLSFSGVLPYLGLVPAIIVGLLAGVLIGLVNGLIIAYTGVPPFITTLATMLISSGIAMILTGGAPIYYPHKFFTSYGDYKILGLSCSVYTWILFLILIGILLHKTKFGAKIYAIGGNERAAIYSGINVKKIKIFLYCISGLMSAIGGFLFLARIGSVTLDSGGSFQMQSIAMVVVGGVLLEGGKGSIKDALVGSLILASLGNIMNIMVVNQYLQSSIEGIVILLAVMTNVRMNSNV